MRRRASGRRWRARLRDSVDPLALGLMVRAVRAEGLAASRGATDFGEYFVYFSFFLVVSALLLVALFFKLGVEQRAREVGLLRAVGFDAARGAPAVPRRRAACSRCLGSALGVLGAVGYAWLIMTALRHVVGRRRGHHGAARCTSRRPRSLAGAAGGVLAAVVCIWWTLRGLRRVSERSLLAGQVSLADDGPPTGQRAGTPRLAAAIALARGWRPASSPARRPARSDRPARSSAPAPSLLVGVPLPVRVGAPRRHPRHAVAGHGWRPVSRLGLRNATHRPGRSVLSTAVIASATFILIAVDAFRRDGAHATADPQSGVGGYQVFVETAAAGGPRSRTSTARAAEPRRRSVESAKCEAVPPAARATMPAA